METNPTSLSDMGGGRKMEHFVISKPDFKIIMKLAKKGDGFKYADKALKNGYIGKLEGIVYGMPPKP